MVSFLFLCTAACAGMEPVEGTGTSSSANVVDEEASDEENDLGYGWETKLNDKTIGKYSLGEIVTNSKVKVRSDGRSCVGCHSWAEYQDRDAFCGRVDAFLRMPTLEEGANDPRAKPASLKKLLKDWKKAGCPN